MSFPCPGYLRNAILRHWHLATVIRASPYQALSVLRRSSIIAYLGCTLPYRPYLFRYERQQNVKKIEIKPWQKKQWCLGKITSDFIWHMEDVLDLYEQPYNPKHPVICYDERPCQLIDDVIVLIPMKPGKPRKRDYEVHAWERERNRTKATVRWQFTKEDARDKFHRHYHNIQN